MIKLSIIPADEYLKENKDIEDKGYGESVYALIIAITPILNLIYLIKNSGINEYGTFLDIFNNKEKK